MLLEDIETLVFSAVAAISIVVSVVLYQRLYQRYCDRAHDLGRSVLSAQKTFLVALVLVSTCACSLWLRTVPTLLAIPVLAPAVAAAVVDARTRFIPNILTACTWMALFVALCLFSYLTGTIYPVLWVFLVGILGGVVAGAAHLSGLGLSMGDVKLFPPLLMVAMITESATGFIVSLLVLPGIFATFLLLRGENRHSTIAYGPWLVVAVPSGIIASGYVAGL